MASRPELIAIVGPTASGKSDLALKLAQEFDGEIICADSRTIYKDMDIGTAKPSPVEQKAAVHWGLDLIEPGQGFSASQFKDYADTKILDIKSRSKLPILVGGTGLYIDGVLYNFSFISGKKHRPFYSLLSTKRLQKIIQVHGWDIPENATNRRHLMRTIERGGQIGTRRHELPESILLIGLMPPDEVLRKRISDRADKMFDEGIVKETKGLMDQYGKKAVNSTGGIVYKVVIRLVAGEIDEAQAIRIFKTADWRYAGRQKTWFKRDRHIKWFTSSQEAYKAVKKQLLNT